LRQTFSACVADGASRSPDARPCCAGLGNQPRAEVSSFRLFIALRCGESGPSSASSTRIPLRSVTCRNRMGPLGRRVRYHRARVRTQRRSP
jgi:hypothetical protein